MEGQAERCSDRMSTWQGSRLPNFAGLATASPSSGSSSCLQRRQYANQSHHSSPQPAVGRACTPVQQLAPAQQAARTPFTQPSHLPSHKTLLDLFSVHIVDPFSAHMSAQTQAHLYSSLPQSSRRRTRPLRSSAMVSATACCSCRGSMLLASGRLTATMAHRAQTRLSTNANCCKPLQTCAAAQHSRAGCHALLSTSTPQCAFR